MYLGNSRLVLQIFLFKDSFYIAMQFSETENDFKNKISNCSKSKLR